MSDALRASPLGKTSATPDRYAPGLLCPIPRSMTRDELCLGQDLPFVGHDLWTAYELGWLNPKGKPQVGIGYISVPCETPNIVESKSFKLYLNSFNGERLSGVEALIALIERDLNRVLWAQEAPRSRASCRVLMPEAFDQIRFGRLEGLSLDRLDIELGGENATTLVVDEDAAVITETVHSNLIRALCRVTGQPDWGSIQIDYVGRPINHERLLRYLIGFRNQQEFHEPLAERVFMDIWRACKPLKLCVQLRFTRRGGLDISPLRSSYPLGRLDIARLARQ